MTAKAPCLEMVHAHSDQKRDVALADLSLALTDFCDHFCIAALVGRSFVDLVDGGGGGGAQRASRLLTACGYADDPEGFFADLLGQLGKGTSGPIDINGVALPHLLLVAILEVAMPGNRFITVRTVDELERLADLEVPQDQRANMQQGSALPTSYRATFGPSRSWLCHPSRTNCHATCVHLPTS